MFRESKVNSDSSNEDMESTDEEDDDCITVKKKRKSGASSFFAADFQFDVGNNEAETDDLRGVRPYLKNCLPSTLQEKIEKARSILFARQSSEGDQADVDISFVQELETVKDSVRDKKSGKRQMKKQTECFFDESVDIDKVTTASSNLLFSQMNLSRPLLRALNKCGFTETTLIQASCIPFALAGRDICACSSTGTGKTAAFMLPILERLLFKPKHRQATRVIILVPTRELAIQVFQVSRQMAEFIHVDICLCAGGLDSKAQESALRRSPDIVIATPGRLIDHLHNSPNFNLNDIEVIVLDEADRMLDDAFSLQMKEILRLCSRRRQTMLFSATMTDNVEDLAAVSLNNPVKLFVDENTKTALNLRQEFIRIRQNHENDREAIVVALITRTFLERTILFVRTKRDCQRMNIILGLLGIKASQLHSGLTQSQRIETLSNFKHSKLDVLVATDLASRGIDIDNVLTVVNMNTPSTLKQYVHRVGRTARAGRVGRSITLVGEEERKILKEIIATNKEGILKQRQVNNEVIGAYRERIAQLEESIKAIEEEEKAERAMRLAEQELKRSEEFVNGEVKKRNWIKQGKPNIDELKSKILDAPKSKKKSSKSVEPKMDDEDKHMRNIAEYQIRCAKRARKTKKIRTVIDNDDRMYHDGKQKRKRKNSSRNFADHFTSIGRGAIKRFRSGPSDAKFRGAKRKRQARGKK